ncbi:MAG: bifunctional (p)ppGpp synthetase/guanosine-3',5'-bis(diphosphate) 3'-pyrophosphohydrolase [Jaaginema sp. PMC 1079.18]|nr:bifunctional (p)ppGpp synthetase/guanosine-3',5'-bis(diphosphate) 3'-pyrophosphohydrolase [Jaaginema sp. PMC 1080.18]MEC4852927.1 bifunctional (p)ppGpp synthetase/guanosine-3',5'-bis(diphosphate) 3'-pyrophosphohydrolase [Jaaginema sp. PMC 1079.18]MEC4865234.1 bifunctional (p)ppGpp synthetase/guanosine-3',5'-bis(diphosphate) 3'-pyrophosphohydrolase [Jaaginema sp. PMC 1078.18]
MITTNLASTPTADFVLPEWLNQCLIIQQKNDADATADNDLICRAFEFAYTLHEGQRRKSGEPYIVHPVTVAGMLRDLGGDSATIAAGFLHDVVEDTEVTPAEIEEQFGEEVRHLVEGVTKLSSFNFSSKTERQAENFRRMFMAMAQDIRVIVVKLADRLHNMRTLQHLRPEKQRRIAQETMDIFAPLANRLGIGRFKWELEDLSFKYLEPEAYRHIQTLVAERRIDREERITQVIECLRTQLRELGINVFEIKGRPKHLYSIYQKMQRQHKEFDEIYDIAALRIITETNDACYRALAVVHDQFKPIPGRFKDYIGLPKPNRYQSLHTSVVGLTGRPLEVQIRTIEMHHVAEYGIAAHWIYKESGNSQNTHLSPEDEKFTWLRQLLEWQNDLKDAQEYVDSLKDNLFEDEVYVFTPDGDAIPLKRGATPVDFAYRIHTEVGNHMKGARINGRWTVLDTPLQNGDIVEIITSKNSHPSLDWLNFVVTPSARNRIRQWFKRSHREANIARGRELLEKELGKNGFDALLKSEPMQMVAERCNYHSVDDLLAALGYAEVTLNHVVNRLRDAVKTLQPIEENDSKMPATGQAYMQVCNPPTPNQQTLVSPIAGVEGLLYYIAGCCNPLPGEPIIGIVTRSRGISIHCQGCHNTDNIEGGRLVPVNWNPIPSPHRSTTYIVNLQIETIDRVGVFKDILARLSDRNVNVCNASVETRAGHPATINLGIQIRDRPQFESVQAQIRKISDVLNVRRVDNQV